MNEEYYYVIDGKRHGPVPFERLRELAAKAELNRNDKVWCKEMKQWQQANSVEKLFDDLPPDLEPSQTHPNAMPVESVATFPLAQASQGQKVLAPTLDPLPGLASIPSDKSGPSVGFTAPQIDNVSMDRSKKLSPRQRAIIGIVAGIVIVMCFIIFVPALKFLMAEGRDRNSQGDSAASAAHAQSDESSELPADNRADLPENRATHSAVPRKQAENPVNYVLDRGNGLAGFYIRHSPAAQYSVSGDSLSLPIAEGCEFDSLSAYTNGIGQFVRIDGVVAYGPNEDCYKAFYSLVRQITAATGLPPSPGISGQAIETYGTNGTYLIDEAVWHAGSNAIQITLNKSSNAVRTAIYALDLLPESDDLVRVLNRPRTKSALDRLGPFNLLQRFNSMDYRCEVDLSAGVKVAGFTCYKILNRIGEWGYFIYVEDASSSVIRIDRCSTMLSLEGAIQGIGNEKSNFKDLYGNPYDSSLKNDWSCWASWSDHYADLVLTQSEWKYPYYLREVLTYRSSFNRYLLAKAGR